MPDRKLREAAVTVVRVRDTSSPPAAEDLRVLVYGEQRVPIDIACPRQRHQFATPEKVLVFDLEAHLVRAALAVEIEAGCQAPHVPHAYAQVNRLLGGVIAGGLDPGVVQIAAAAQQALRFGDFLLGNRLGLFEQQLGADIVVTRKHVQVVGPTVDGHVLPGLRGIKDVFNLDVDVRLHPALLDSAIVGSSCDDPGASQPYPNAAPDAPTSARATRVFRSRRLQVVDMWDRLD